MEIRVLGPLEVISDSGSIVLGSRKQQTVLAMLVSAAGQTVSADRLIDALWEEEPPDTADHALQVHVGNLRKALEPDHVRGEPWQTIQTEPDGYRLPTSAGAVDARRFDEALERARALAPGEAVEVLREATGLWRGRPYGDLGDLDPLRPEVARLEQVRERALEDLFQAELELGNHREVIAEIEVALTKAPYSERLWGQLMIALYRSGRQVDALRAFGRVRMLLGEELGIEPGPDLVELEDRILLQDPALNPPRRGQPGNLPTPLSSFVGRTTEIGDLSALVGSERLVTLIGAPGVGKSRLAREVARSVADEHPAGTWYLDVEAVSDPEVLGPALVNAFRLDHQPSDATVDVIARHLGGDRALLVLDGCEHLASEIGALVKGVLEACPGLSVLATSRMTLGTAGEALFPVVPLTPGGDAADLFLARARSANPGLSVDRSMAERIASQLDGVPLAIELAAVRLGVLTAEQVLAQLEERVVPLVGADRDGDALTAALDWTVELLPEPVRATHMRLSVFRGGFDLEGAAQVAAISTDDAIDHVAALARHSLLEANPIGGVMVYRMLDPVRRHARRSLVAGGGDEAALERHTTYVIDLVARSAVSMQGSGQLEVLDRLDAAAADIRSVAGRVLDEGDLESGLKLVAHASRYWFLRARLREGWHWLERTIESAGDEDSVVLARALVAGGQFAWEHAADERAQGWLERAYEMAGRLDAHRVQAWAALYQVLIGGARPTNLDRVRVLAEEATDKFAELGDFLGLGFARWMKALLPLATYYYEDSPIPDEVAEATRAELLELLAIIEPFGDRNLTAHLQWTLGLLEALREEPQAGDTLRRAVRLLAELGNLSCICHVVDGLVLHVASAGDGEEAARLLGGVEGLRDRLGNAGHDFERRVRARAHAAMAGVLDDENLARLIEEGRGDGSPERLVAMALASTS